MMRSDGLGERDEVGPPTNMTDMGSGRQGAAGAMTWLKLPAVNAAVLNGAATMTHLILLAKVLAQIAVAALPGGLLLVGLYHWRSQRQKKRRAQHLHFHQDADAS